MSTPLRAVGIDAGATLWKLALWADHLETVQFPAQEIESARAWIAAQHPKRITATGGGAQRFGTQIDGVPIETELEFAAWARGGPVLAAQQGLDLPARYLLVSIGTGTSALAVDADGFRRAGGTALGGGALLGLARLLVGVQSFAELVALARRGDRRRVDLLVGDIYPQGLPALPSDLNAASFAKLDSRAPEDLAHALVAMIGENVALLCGEFAKAHHADCLVFGGSTVAANPPLQQVLQQRAAALGQRAFFLERGGFCGAVGAAVKHGRCFAGSPAPRAAGELAGLR
jgi:type II pantothenate kinase